MNCTLENLMNDLEKYKTYDFFQNRNIYYMAKPVLNKSVRSYWFFLGRDFAVQTNGLNCVFLFWSKAGKFKIWNQNSKKNVNIIILDSETSTKFYFYF